jgi:hypothetical protein
MLSLDLTVNEGMFSELCIGRDVEGSDHLKQDLTILQKNCKKPGKVCQCSQHLGLNLGHLKYVGMLITQLWCLVIHYAILTLTFGKTLHHSIQETDC